jgi:hypothetical protein
MSKDYYFILMSQKDFLENQVIEEILRERANYYVTKEKLKDFWIVNSPNFINLPEIRNKINSSKFYKQKVNIITTQLNSSSYEFYSALVTSDYEFIKWIQLRLGYFEDINNLITDNNYFVSDGLFGKINEKTFNNTSLLDYSFDYIHPDILLDRYKKSIEIYYKFN